MTAAVEFRDVRYEVAGRTILDGISFCLEPGCTLVLLGRSGSGKTTALKMVNGLLRPTSGQVLVGGRATSDWDVIALRRQTGYVIQEAGLLPHFSVGRNVALVPSLSGESNFDASPLLQQVGLPAADFADRLPHQLSGGQRQRVGFARALAADPPLLLCDEPFGALDPVTRREMQILFRELNTSGRRAAIFVTHDLREAIALGDQIGLLHQGRLEYFGPGANFSEAHTPEARAFLDSLSSP